MAPGPTRTDRFPGPRKYTCHFNFRDPCLLADLHISRETLHLEGFFPLCERSGLSGSLQTSPPPSPGDAACTTLGGNSPAASGFPASAVSHPRTDQMFLSYYTSGRETCGGFHPSSHRLQMKCAALTLRCFCLGSEAALVLFPCTPSRRSAQGDRGVFRSVQP